MTTANARTQGIHHAGLTVPDLAASCAFFEGALGFERVGEVADYPAIFLSDGVVLITLWQAENPAEAIAFDRRRNLGLHHLALRVADPAALAKLHGDLGERSDVKLEFGPEALGAGPTQHMMCTIPGGIRLELIAPVQG